jgi:hypothetical protein
MIKSSRLRWTGNVAHTGEMKNACRILVGKPDRGPHGRPHHRWRIRVT